MTPAKLEKLVRDFFRPYKNNRNPIDLADLMALAEDVARVQHDETASKALHVLDEFEFDLDSDIEGCNGDELLDIEHKLAGSRLIRKRMCNYLAGITKSPRGVVGDDSVMTPEPKLERCRECGMVGNHKMDCSRPKPPPPPLPPLDTSIMRNPINFK